MGGYYDIDAILAEEELIPCKSLFDFTYLSHLDPDYYTTSSSSGQQRKTNDHHKTDENDYNYLPEGSRIRMPLWSIRKWADLNFIQIGIPKQYRLVARERLEADPVQMNLRKFGSTSNNSNCSMMYPGRCYFRTGKMFIDLIETSCRAVSLALRLSSSTSSSAPVRLDRERAKRMNELDHLLFEANQIKVTLLYIYKGQRLSQTLNWSLSSVGDDVTSYTSKLTEMERRLYRAGAMSSLHHQLWKIYNNRRLIVATSSSTMQPSSSHNNPKNDATNNKRQFLRNATSSDKNHAAMGVTSRSAAVNVQRSYPANNKRIRSQ